MVTVDVLNPSQQGFVGISNKWLARIERGALIGEEGASLLPYSAVPTCLHLTRACVSPRFVWPVSVGVEPSDRVQDEVVLLALHLSDLSASYVLPSTALACHAWRACDLTHRAPRGRHMKRQYPQWHESKDRDAVLVEDACTTGSIVAVRVGCLDEALPTALGTVVAWKDAVNMMVHKTSVELVRRRAVQEDWLRVTLRELLSETLEQKLDETKLQRRGRRRSALLAETQDMELGAATNELDVDWLRNP